MLLSRQLVARFGALDSESAARVAGASAAEIDAWGLRVLSAKSLAEVFEAPRPKPGARR